MPSSDDDRDLKALKDFLPEFVAHQRSLRQKRKSQGHKEVDWGQATVDALNRHTGDPEWSARYMRWLEEIGPGNWTPVAKADYEKMKAEGIKPAPDDEKKTSE